MRHCLTIAGSDCSGGAGVQADIKAFCANGVYAMSVITSVVAENTKRVISVYDMPLDAIEEQIDAVFEDISVDGVKIGMTKSSDIMECIAEKLKFYQPPKIVLDPVMLAKNNHPLMEYRALNALRENLIPLATVITPNIPEAEMIAGQKIKNIDDMISCAKRIHRLGADCVLIKGGHSNGQPDDILYDGKKVYKFSSVRINTKNTHGTGCTISSAITAFLARGYSADEAVLNAKRYIFNTIKYSLDIGSGSGPLNHFYDYYNMKGFDEK